MRKWFFSYLEHIVAIIVILGLYLVKDFFNILLPSWLPILPLVIALTVRMIRDSVKTRRDELHKLVFSIGELITEFSKFTKSSYSYSLGSMATETLSKYRGEKDIIKGWAAYFDKNWGMPARLFGDWGKFEGKWVKYVENPKGQNEFKLLTLEFLGSVALHYQMHNNLRELAMMNIKNDWGFAITYKEFKREYDEFHRNLRRVAPNLKKSMDIDITGVFYYDFAKDL